MNVKRPLKNERPGIINEVIGSALTNSVEKKGRNGRCGESKDNRKRKKKGFASLPFFFCQKYYDVLGLF